MITKQLLDLVEHENKSKHRWVLMCNGNRPEPALLKKGGTRWDLLVKQLIGDEQLWRAKNEVTLSPRTALAATAAMLIDALSFGLCSLEICTMFTSKRGHRVALLGCSAFEVNSTKRK